jgi:Sulfotransferase family
VRRLPNLRIGSRPSGDGGVDLPPPVPRCPPGWRTGPPDFVGVGVQRAGTTRWFRLIASHPEVLKPPAGTKELHYFDQFHEGGFGEPEAARYHEYFPREEGLKVGEWTPMYCAAPWVAPLLAAAAPEARLLVLLRDPVERYLSGLQLGREVAARRDAPLSRYGPLEAFARGLYHAQLATLLEHFARERLLVLQYERCAREPAAELARTFEFIGLKDTAFQPDLERHPRQQKEKPALDARARAAFVAAYADDVTTLVAAFPEIDLSLWPNFTHLA